LQHAFPSILPLQAQIVQWLVQPGDTVQAGDVLVILEAMKMEHEVRASHAARVTELFYAAGESVAEGDLLLNQELLVHAINRCPPLNQPYLSVPDMPCSHHTAASPRRREFGAEAKVGHVLIRCRQLPTQSK
jgi:hypothetical protein